MRDKSRKFGELIANYSFGLVGAGAALYGFTSMTFDGVLISLVGMLLVFSSLDRNVYYKRYCNLTALINDKTDLSIKRIQYTDYEIVEDDDE